MRHGWLVVGAEDQHGQPGIDLADTCNQLDSVAIWQVQVQQHQVIALRYQLSEQLSAIAGFGPNPDIASLLKQLHQPPSHQRMVVHDE